jgi:hypothetical protein
MREAILVAGVVGLLAGGAAGDTIVRRANAEEGFCWGVVWRGLWNTTHHGEISFWNTREDNQSNCAVAHFDRGAVQNAINAEGPNWDARLVATYYDWMSEAPHAQMIPVAGLFTTDTWPSQPVDSGNSTSHRADHANGVKWGLSGTEYGSFEAMVEATVAPGVASIAMPPWSLRPGTGIIDIVVDIDDAMVTEYLNNTSVTGFYLSDHYEQNVDVAGNSQAGGAHFLRLEFIPEPATMMLMGLGGLGLLLRKRR